MLKKNKIAVLLFAFAFGGVLQSCGGGCDTSTPDGAAACICDFTAETEGMEPDDEGAEELTERIFKTMGEIKKEIDKGSYTDEEFTKALEAADCAP